MCSQKEKKEETFGLVIPGKSLVSETSLSHFMHVFSLIVVSAMQSFVLYVLSLLQAFALHESLEKEFLALACLCKAVICCRVTPLQKVRFYTTYNRLPASLNFLVSFSRQDNSDTHNVVVMESSSVSFLSTHMFRFR